MSELARFKRLAKSLIPKFSSSYGKYYSHSDAKLMITDLAHSISPQSLAYLVDSDEVLEDFLHSIYELERSLGRKVVTSQYMIDPELEPKAYEEDGKVLFTVMRKREEIVFTEYDTLK